MPDTNKRNYTKEEKEAIAKYLTDANIAVGEFYVKGRNNTIFYKHPGDRFGVEVHMPNLPVWAYDMVPLTDFQKSIGKSPEGFDWSYSRLGTEGGLWSNILPEWQAINDVPIFSIDNQDQWRERDVPVSSWRGVIYDDPPGPIEEWTLPSFNDWLDGRERSVDNRRIWRKEGWIPRENPFSPGTYDYFYGISTDDYPLWYPGSTAPGATDGGGDTGPPIGNFLDFLGLAEFADQSPADFLSAISEDAVNYFDRFDTGPPTSLREQLRLREEEGLIDAILNKTALPGNDLPFFHQLFDDYNVTTPPSDEDLQTALDDPDRTNLLNILTDLFSESSDLADPFELGVLPARPEGSGFDWETIFGGNASPLQIKSARADHIGFDDLFYYLLNSSEDAGIDPAVATPIPQYENIFPYLRDKVEDNFPLLNDIFSGVTSTKDAIESIWGDQYSNFEHANLRNLINSFITSPKHPGRADLSRFTPIDGIAPRVDAPERAPSPKVTALPRSIPEVPDLFEFTAEQPKIQKNKFHTLSTTIPTPKGTRPSPFRTAPYTQDETAANLKPNTDNPFDSFSQFLGI